MRYVATGVHEKEEREREKGKLEPSVLGWYYGTTGENVSGWQVRRGTSAGRLSFQSGRGRGTRVRSGLGSAAIARGETDGSLVCKTKNPSRRSRA